MASKQKTPSKEIGHIEEGSNYWISNRMHEIISDYLKTLPKFSSLRNQIKMFDTSDSDDFDNTIYHFKFPDYIAKQLISLKLKSCYRGIMASGFRCYDKLMVLYPDLTYEVLFEHKDSCDMLWDILYAHNRYYFPKPKYMIKAIDIIERNVRGKKVLGPKYNRDGDLSHSYRSTITIKEMKSTLNEISGFYISYAIILYMQKWLNGIQFKSSIFDKNIYTIVIKLCLGF